MRFTMPALLASLVFLVACGGSSTPPLHIDLVNPDRCEFLNSGYCLLPFPSDALTREDATTDTGRRINFNINSMLANNEDVLLDPTEWNRNDGFSPGAILITQIPGIDAVTSALPPVTDLERSMDADSSIVLLDADTGKRVPFWSELDASFADGEEAPVLIRPATALREGHRHIVALRGMKTADGSTIEAGEVFAAYRDDVRTDSDDLEARRPAMEAIFADLKAAGVAREDLFLAWDFTVQSQSGLSERLLHLRNDAFTALGDDAPDFRVDSITDGGTAHIVTGVFEAPLYLTGDGSPGSVFNDTGGDSLPTRNGTRAANFVCTVPKGATPASPARQWVFGHGLLGAADQTVGLGIPAGALNIAFCGADWIGMSTEDIGQISAALAELTQFRAIADRLQQGHLEFLFLGRAMIHPEGFGSHPAFQNETGASVLSETDLSFLGASQGGILGGATTAIATDWTRAVMAVGAANYSMLIPRSVDFDAFQPLFTSAYPEALDRKLAFALMQMLWDRGEANAYLQHLGSNPYPGTPDHEVLYLAAFGDHQVANVATEYAARSIGAKVREPGLRPGRSTAVKDFWGMDPVPSYPWEGDALVMWDYGTPAPPVENLPAREGSDPHGKAGDVPLVLLMVTEYLQNGGALIDVCGGEACVTE
jgi:hypothetical protein